MGIVQVVAVALLAAVVLVVVRQARPEMAVPLSLLAGAALLMFVLTRVGAVVGLIQDLADRARIESRYAASLLKIIGIAYLAEFGAQVCRDAGEGALAAKVELAGKVFILLLAVPIILAVVETLLRLLPA
ncbi:MAG: stage III sporulation protein AD [Thermaerobacter sp.]|nr:stage III sporulation protein AD [Bacillota bacterium]REJ34499.1 MAG: stage III sporulation protein AD [Bacillota bacterium]